MQQDQSIQIIGEIVSGRGTGKNRMSKLSDFFSQNGVAVFPGTLNVIFMSPIFLDNSKADFVYNNNYYFWEATINNISCYLYRWAHCPDHIVEIVAETKLREKINTDSNQIVTIQLNNYKVKKSNFSQKLFWVLAWKGRAKLYYTNDLYAKLISKILNLKCRINRLFSI